MITEKDIAAYAGNPEALQQMDDKIMQRITQLHEKGDRGANYDHLCELSNQIQNTLSNDLALR